MYDPVGVGQQLDPLVHDPGVGDQVQGLVTEEGDEGLVVNCQGEQGEAQEEVPALVSGPSSRHGFPFNGGIILLSLGAKSAADCDGLPPCLAASWRGALAGAALLTQPVAYPKFGPISGKASGEGWVKHPDPLGALADNFSLGCLKGIFQLC